MLLTAALSFLLICLVVVTLLIVRTPRYRIQKENIISLLELVVSGQASANDWSVFTAVPLNHDEYLESIRLRCLEIEEREYTGDAQLPYLFTPQGLDELAGLLRELKCTGD